MKNEIFVRNGHPFWYETETKDAQYGEEISYTRTDLAQAAIEDLRAMVELGIYYARQSGDGAKDATQMYQTLENTKQWSRSNED